MRSTNDQATRTLFNSNRKTHTFGWYIGSAVGSVLIDVPEDNVEAALG